MKNLTKEVLTDTTITIAVKLIAAILKFILVIYITNTFGASGFGAYTFSVTIFLLINLIFRFGFDLYVQKEVSIVEANDQNNVSVAIFLETVSFSTIFILLASVVVNSILSLAPDIFSDVKYEYLSLIMIFSFLHPVFWISGYYYRGLGKGKLSVINSEIVFPVIQFFFIFLLYSLDGSHPEALVFSYAVAMAICSACYLYGIKDKLADFFAYSGYKRLEFPIRHIRSSYPFLMVSMSALLLSWTDILVISFLESNSDLGIYSVVTKIGFLIMMPTSAAAIFFNNKVASWNSTGEKTLIYGLFLALTRYLIFVSISAFLIINIFGAQVLSVFGEEFAAATKVLLIITLAQTINASAGVFESVFTMTDMKMVFFKINIFTLVVNLSLNIPMVLLYGIQGAAIATLFSIMFGRLVQFMYLKKGYFND